MKRTRLLNSELSHEVSRIGHTASITLCDAGEVLGIFGLMGAGRTELLESVFGLWPRQTTGAVFVDGKECVSRRSWSP